MAAVMVPVLIAAGGFAQTGTPPLDQSPLGPDQAPLAPDLSIPVDRCHTADASSAVCPAKYPAPLFAAPSCIFAAN